MTLRIRLLLVSVLVLLVSIGGCLAVLEIVVLPTEVKNRRSDLAVDLGRLWRQGLQAQVRVLRLSLERVETDQGLMTWLARDTEAAATPLAENVFQRISDRFGVDGMLLAAPNGQVLFERLPGGDVRPAARSEPGTQLQGLELRVQSGIRQDRTRFYQVFVVAPLMRSDEVVGTVILSARLDRLLETVAETVSPTRPRAAVLDLRGQPVSVVGDDWWEEIVGRIEVQDGQYPVVEHDGRSYWLVSTPILDPDDRLLGHAVVPMERGETGFGVAEQRMLAYGVALLLLIGLLSFFSRALRSELEPVDAMIGALEELARGNVTVAIPEHADQDEAGRMRAALQTLRQRALALVTLQISRDKQRSRQQRFIRRQMLSLAGTLEAREREQVLQDLDRLEKTSTREATGERTRRVPLEASVFGRDLVDRAQEDFGLLAAAFQNMAVRLRDQYERLDGLVKELNEALKAKSEYVLLQQELDVARKMQLSILPQAFPERPDMSIHGLMLPAKEVGGDFYDFFLLDDDTVAITVADVSGKGVPAAFFSLITRTLLKATAVLGVSPAVCIDKLNRLLCTENEQMMFVTLFFGVLDGRTGQFRYVNAGHPPPMLLSASGQVQPLEATAGMALAVFEEATFSEGSVQLRPGDLIVFYTDGVTEAFSPDEEEFGEQRLRSVVATQAGTPTWMVPQSISNAVKDFEAGGHQSDDLTTVVVGYHRDVA